MLIQEKRSVTLELKKIGEIHPSDLVTFSPEYMEHIILLKDYFSKNIGKVANILVARMENNGEVVFKKKYSGLIKSVAGNLITVESAKDPASGMLHDELQEFVIRTDNVLGLLPFLASGRNINPFIDSENEISLDFLDFIKRSRNLLKTCLEQVHYVELIFHTEMNGISGNEIVECEIKHVNKSNLEVNQIKKILHANGGKSITLGNFQTVLPFRTDTRFLKKIIIHYGSKLKINPYDDGEEF